MEDLVDIKKEGNRKLGLFILLIAILLFVTGVFCFKNELFFSTSQVFATDTNETVMHSYSYQEGSYVAIDDKASMKLSGFETAANEITLFFKNGLEEDTRFCLYNSSDNIETYPIEQKDVRKGYKKISFYFENTYFNNVTITATSLAGDHFVKIPSGNIVLNVRLRNMLQSDKNVIILLTAIFVCSVVLAIILGLLKSKNSTIADKRSKRDSNLELLRVLCMFLLVAHHFSAHGGLLNLGYSVPKYVGLIFLPVGKTCFLAFIAISMYFLVDGKNSFERFLKCWLEVAFYSVSLTAITWILGGCVSLKSFISSFFVMTSNSHGFAASYLLFLLIYPFLLRATVNCTQRQSRYLLLVLFMIQILSQILRTWTGYNQPVYSELTLFVFCYVLSLNLKRYPIKVLDKKLFDFIIVLFVWAFILIIKTIPFPGVIGNITTLLSGITGDESSIFYIIGGYALFYLFKNIRVPHSKFINSIAAGTFGVLLIHDHNFLRHLFWNDIVRTQTYFHSEHFIIHFAITVTAIFMVCLVIDYLRRELLEKNIAKSKIYKRVTEYMNAMLKIN